MLLTGSGEVIELLEIKPVVRASFEVFTKAQGCGGGDSLAAFDDVGDAAMGNADVPGKAVLGDPKIAESLLERFAGMRVV